MTIKLSTLQEQVVAHRDGAMLVVAGPGAGKTRVIIERIRRILLEDRQHYKILALTFTNKAANELKGRLQDIPDAGSSVVAGTMHSFCMEVLLERGEHVGISGMPNLFEAYQDRRQALTDSINENPGIWSILSVLPDQKSRQKKVNDWLDNISEAKRNLLTPEMVDDTTLQSVYRGYDEALRASNAIDFDDLLLLTYKLFIERPKIADFYRRQFKYICIDEAQDLNESQYQLIRALCGGAYKNVMMVGDPRQAIFIWNGASPQYLNRFSADFGAVQINLLENFRSSVSVVRAAQALVPDFSIEGNLPLQGGIKFYAAPDEIAESQYVCDAIQELINSGHQDIEGAVSPEQIAIIARTKYAFGSIGQLLGAKGIPSHTSHQGRRESESDLLKDFSLCLRLAANPLDKLHLRKLLKSWKVDDCFADEDSTRTWFEVAALLKTLALERAAHAILDATCNLDAGDDDLDLMRTLVCLERFADTLEIEDERALVLKDVSEWKESWDQFLRTASSRRLSSFLAQMALGSINTGTIGVSMLTVHSSKGLEFDVVFIVGLSEGTFPDFRATGPQLHEEKNNAFVAVTRARRLLYLTYPKQKRMPWGAFKAQSASRFFSAIVKSYEINSLSP